MVQTKPLLVVDVVTDSEVAHADIGDVEYTIHAADLERFLEKHGAEGAMNIIKRLDELKVHVIEKVGAREPHQGSDFEKEWKEMRMNML